MSRDEDNRRRDALDASIRAVMPDMSLRELKQLDAEQRRILAERDQTLWVRHEGDVEKWHLVTEIVSGAILTACNGSMPVSDKPDLEARPARADRCAACQAKYIALKTRRLAQQRLDRGLAELRDANAAPLPRAEVVR